jgi:hypothetical protein
MAAGCTAAASGPEKQTFSGDVAFLQKHTEVVVLKDSSGGSQVVVLPRMQGRVMTSTAEGPDGYSFGWINRELVASGKFAEHMNAFGGEDRFWIGPEGGQFSIFFKKVVPFDLEHWYTPASVDTEAWELVSKSSRLAALRKTMRLENYSGTAFDVRVDREVRVLDRDEAVKALGIAVGPEVKVVAFESNNKMTNTGEKAWAKETGLLSIWIHGMFTPSPQTTVVVPFVTGPEDRLGPIVNDAYFGKVPAERLVVRDGVLFFSGDGQYRSKIGLSPNRAKSILGSYDAANKALTVVQYSKPEGVTDYVNSMWEIQKAPYAGDTINSYNDGPPAPGAKPLGPFYEMETSSPAAALAAGQSILHTHRTFHFKGSDEDLDAISRSTLGVTIAQIKSALR